MIEIQVDKKVVGLLPDNVNKEKLQDFLSLFMFNQEVKWKEISVAIK